MWASLSETRVEPVSPQRVIALRWTFVAASSIRDSDGRGHVLGDLPARRTRYDETL
jgi:hypothetical protein